MEKAFVSEISISNVVNRVVNEVAVNEVPVVVEDVQVQVSEPTVVNGSEVVKSEFENVPSSSPGRRTK